MGHLYEQPVQIMVIQNEDRSYRPLDQRTLEILRASDHWNRGQKKVLNEIEQSQIRTQHAIRVAERQETEDLVRDITPRGGFEDPWGAVNLPKEDMPIQVPREIEEDEI